MIEDKREIAALLYRLMMQNASLMAVSRDLDAACKTSLADIDLEDDVLYFDELTPSDANRCLISGHPIRLYGWLDGVRMDFIVDIADNHLIDEHGSYFSTDVPLDLSYPQRRLEYRIRTHTANVTLSASLTVDEQTREKLECDVVDLSVGGVGLMLPDEQTIAIGDRFPCLLRLPDTSLKSELEVCSMTVLDKPTRTRLGTRFTHLSTTAFASLQRFIAAVQRQQLRER